MSSATGRSLCYAYLAVAVVALFMMGVERNVEVQTSNGRNDTRIEMPRELEHAILTGNSGVVQGYLEKNSLLSASVNADGDPALLLASEQMYNEILRLLVNHKAPVDQRSLGGETALFAAARTGNLDGIAILVKAGADVNAEDCVGRTPLRFAVCNHKAESAKLLVRLGASTGMPDASGRKVEDDIRFFSASEQARMLAAIRQNVSVKNTEDSARYMQ